MKQPKLAALLLGLLCFAACTKTELTNKLTASGTDLATGATPPNIIIILSDDLGYEIPNYTGGQSYSTPNINQMAAAGLQFNSAYASPLCSPSRFMLLTAKYNFRNYTTWGVMDTSQKTIANLLKTKGYATCAAGKWQLNGGDSSIRAFGFDKYLVTYPYKTSVEENDGFIRYYKNPQVYENGAFWTDDRTKDKYGEDLIRDYMFSFIDSNKNKKPFFIYWAPNLVHDPYCPTPDDPEFATWNPALKPKPGDTVFFPSMVKYHDKVIGQLMAKLRNSNIAGKTLILWMGDNGTSRDIYSVWNGKVVRGGKSTPEEAGTHVPMVAYMPGKILPGLDTNLVSLVDFMSTIGDAAGATIPASYGKTDGISFYNQLFGNNSSVRPWIFCHFMGSGKVETNPLSLRRWMHDKTYKQYDTLPNTAFNKKFYNVATDPQENHPIDKSKMTSQEKKISNQFLKNMQQLH